MAGKIADVLKNYNGEKVAMMFVDGSGVGGNAGAVVARVRARLQQHSGSELRTRRDRLDSLRLPPR
jgi:hypothetical protein